MWGGNAVGMVLGKHLHLPIKEQHQKLTQKLRGHCGYYGITGNFASLHKFREAVRRIWRHKSFHGEAEGSPISWDLSSIVWRSDTVFPTPE